MRNSKEYNKRYYKEHKEEYKAYLKAYRKAHREERKAYNKAHREEHKAQSKAYYKAHKEEVKARVNAYRHAHKDDIRAYKNSDGRKPKEYIRKCSSRYLYNTLNFQKIDGYEIHHCFTYNDFKQFIYIPKTLHLEIHQFLRDNNIDADTNHFELIKPILDSCKEKIYIIKDGKITEYK